MTKSIRKLESIVYEILISIRDNGNYKLPKDNYLIDEFEEAIEYAVNSNFINGLTVNRNEMGRLQIDSIRNICVTDEGLCFIEQFKQP